MYCASRLILIALLLWSAAPAAHASGETDGGAAVAPGADPTVAGSEAAVSPDAQLTGREIYERVVANRHRSFYQRQQLVSADAGGAMSGSELWMRWVDGRDEQGKIEKGILSKTIARYVVPRGLEGVGYLVVQKRDDPNDQFIYLPSARRVRRVNLEETIMGTDFSIEDIVPRDIETADYERLEDAEIDGDVRFTIQVVPRRSAGSQYSRMLVHVDKRRSLPIRTDYWDRESVHVKRHTTDPKEIEEIEGVWIARKTVMRNLVEKSATTLVILDIEPNAEMKDSMFTTRALESRRR